MKSVIPPPRDSLHCNRSGLWPWSRVTFMLPCLKVVRLAGLGSGDAAAGVAGNRGVPLDSVRQFIVKQRTGKVLVSIAAANTTGWLP
jgi:hypothetical protein